MNLITRFGMEGRAEFLLGLLSGLLCTVSLVPCSLGRVGRHVLCDVDLFRHWGVAVEC